MWWCALMVCTTGDTRGVTREGKEATIPQAPNHCGRRWKVPTVSQVLQYTTFASERAQLRTWGCQTCSLTRAPLTSLHPWATSNLLRNLQHTSARVFFEPQNMQSSMNAVECYTALTHGMRSTRVVARVMNYSMERKHVFNKSLDSFEPSYNFYQTTEI